MKIWKLVSGILSIVMFIIITIQSFATGVVNALESNNDDTSGSAGIIVAFILLVAGIVSACVWKMKNKGGDIALIVLYGLAALFGYLNLGTFKDLVIWSSWALICAILPAITLFWGVHKENKIETNFNIKHPHNNVRNAFVEDVPRCPYCSSEVSKGDIFCEQCGKKLPVEQVCANCGNKLIKEDRFCPQCGASIPETKEFSTNEPVRSNELLRGISLVNAHVIDKDTYVEQKTAQKNNNTIWIVALSIIIGSLIIAAVIFFLFYGKGTGVIDNKESSKYDSIQTSPQTSLTMRLNGKIGGEAEFVMNGNSGWYRMTYDGADRTKRSLELDSYDSDNNNCIINAYLDNKYIGKFEGVITKENNNQVCEYKGIFESARGSKIDFYLYSE